MGRRAAGTGEAARLSVNSLSAMTVLRRYWRTIPVMGVRGGTPCHIGQFNHWFSARSTRDLAARVVQNRAAPVLVNRPAIFGEAINLGLPERHPFGDKASFMQPFVLLLEVCSSGRNHETVKGSDFICMRGIGYEGRSECRVCSDGWRYTRDRDATSVAGAVRPGPVQ